MSKDRKVLTDHSTLKKLASQSNYPPKPTNSGNVLALFVANSGNITALFVKFTLLTI